MKAVESESIRGPAESWVQARDRSEVFHLSALYEYLEQHFGRECDARGLIPGRNEPQFQHDARQAIRDCKASGLIVPVGRPHSGNYRRT